jgi:hypothetical protein
VDAIKLAPLVLNLEIKISLPSKVSEFSVTDGPPLYVASYAPGVVGKFEEHVTPYT